MKRKAALVVVAAAIAASPGLGSAAHAAGTTVATEASPALLTGDTGWLIYQQGTTVMARSAAGATQTVTTSNSTDSHWSVAGNTLTAARPGGIGVVDWWKLKAGKHGHFAGNAGAFYLSAAPGGSFYSNHTGKLIRRSLSTKKVTTYGKPGAFPNGVAGPAGVLVEISDETTKYVPYAKPHHAVTLKTTATNDNPVACTTIDSKYASCYRFDDDDDNATPSADLLVPLNGKKATVAMKCPGVPSIAGSTIIWATGTGQNGPSSCVTPSPTLDSLTAGTKKVTSSSTAVAVGTTAAFNRAIFVGSDGGSVLAARDANHSKVLFGP